MTTEKHLLNLQLDQIKSVKLPKLDYRKDIAVKKLPTNLVEELKELWGLISDRGIIAPNNLRSHLREIGYIIKYFNFKSNKN